MRRKGSAVKVARKPARRGKRKKNGTALRRGAAARAERILLRLYVTGTTPRSSKAIENLRRICEEHLQGRYNLEVVDIYQQPALAKGEQIIAAPTLIKHFPEPVRKIIGDLSNEARVLFGLDVVPKPGSIAASLP